MYSIINEIFAPERIGYYIVGASTLLSVAIAGYHTYCRIEDLERRVNTVEWNAFILHNENKELLERILEIEGSFSLENDSFESDRLSLEEEDNRMSVNNTD